MEKNYELIPFKSFGPFYFHSDISEYLKLFKFTWHPPEKEVGWERYEFTEPQVDVYAEDGKIISMRCEKWCFLNNKNILGITLDQFIEFIGCHPDSSDSLYMPYDDGYQDVFDFDSVGIQVWAKNSIIVTIFCSPGYDE